MCAGPALGDHVMSSQPYSRFHPLRPLQQGRGEFYLALFAWTILFTLGATVDSAPFVKQFRALTQPAANAPAAQPGKKFDDSWRLASLAAAFVTYTPSNLALLCIIGAYLGSRARSRRILMRRALPNQSLPPVP